MKSCFKEEAIKKIKLSKYLKMSKPFSGDEERRKARTEYIMDIIGDVEMDLDTYELFIQQFQRFGGRYDVRTTKETIKGIYEISQTYPFLSATALDEIWFVYIHDQFQECKLDDALGKFFKRYGKTEDAFEKYLEYVDEVAKEYDSQFEQETIKLQESCKDYDEPLIKHLQYVIKSQHIRADKIIECLPSKELIQKDRSQLSEIIRGTRIFFGACDPISYQMIESLATGGGLDYYPDQPKYSATGVGTIEATFTKKEFLESIKKRKESLKRR